ncbi:MAG: hypothetical protein JJU40_00080, partial [Rhodobacteraceae bacterium]|nr:hypothetical protein [Paracoccaceae bacterium]
MPRSAGPAPSRIGLACLSAALTLFASGASRAEEPLSAIDWLSESVRTTPEAAAPGGLQPLEEAMGLPGMLHDEILAQPLGRVALDAVGLLPPRVTGFPPDLWGAGRTSEIVALIQRQPAETLPEAGALLRRVLLAELEPPAIADSGDGLLFLARLDLLLEKGALEQAQALIERAGSLQPEVFRRWFDISLLLGLEDRACGALTSSPDLAPSMQARIFCLARAGAWPAAALTLAPGEALGFLSPAEAEMLARV